MTDTIECYSELEVVVAERIYMEKYADHGGVWDAVAAASRPVWYEKAREMIALIQDFAAPYPADDFVAALNSAGYETVRLDRASERDGAAWGCKIGVSRGQMVALAGGADTPMRAAVERAFKQATGLDAEFCFSGWGAELTAGEKEALEG